jgi:flagellar motor switch/type III secretory pathway protein FliN
MAGLATVPKLADEQKEAPVEAEAWLQALTLRCDLTVDMPLPGFKVADVLRLRKSAVINSRWRVGSDVPLRVNGRLIARGEFEVVDNHLAVRLTELV